MTHFYSQNCSIDDFNYIYIYKFYQTRKLALNIYVTIKVICNPWFNMLHAQNMQITQSYQIWETIFQNFGQKNYEIMIHTQSKRVGKSFWKWENFKLGHKSIKEHDLMDRSAKKMVWKIDYTPFGDYENFEHSWLFSKTVHNYEKRKSVTFYIKFIVYYFW